MTFIPTIKDIFTSQLKKFGDKLPQNKIPYKITDDNQAINNGVINERPTTNLRSESKPKKRGRPRKSNGKD